MSTALGASKLCAELSRSCAEPLAGTAAHAQVVLAVEERGAWAPKAIESPGLDPIRPTLKTWVTLLDARLQLIRTPDRCSGPRRVYLCRPGPEGRMTELELEDDAFEAFEVLEALDSATSTTAIHLVCTHGKRDRCCALEGNAYFRARGNEPNVWMTSHLGGHRFAATTLTLPSGLCHGHLNADHGAAPFESLPDAHLRGRICYPAPVQVAELALRNAMGGEHFDLQAEDMGGERARVVFSAAGRRHQVDLRRTARPPQVLSCGDVAKVSFTWSVETIDG